MTTNREIEEAAARCVSIAVFYYNSPTSHRSEELYEDDIRAVARWAAKSGLSEREAARGLLEPLRPELVARYGVVVGSGLHAAFLVAYREAWRSERPGQSLPIQVPAAIRP